MTPRMQNFIRGTSEKLLSPFCSMQGKTDSGTELHAGDIGAVAKLKDTVTGDTLGDKAIPSSIRRRRCCRARHHLRH